MPKFAVHATVTVKKYLGEYEAESASDAEQIAFEAAPKGRCPYCAGMPGDVGVWALSAKPAGTKLHRFTVKSRP